MADSVLTNQIRNMIKKFPNAKGWSEREGRLVSFPPKTVVTFKIDFYTKKDAEEFAASVRPLGLDSEITVQRTRAGLFQVQFDP